jgi:uncharacterized protein YndB with AHSA1/START domain
MAPPRIWSKGTRRCEEVCKPVIRFQIDRTIERPIEDVFDRLADVDGYRDWMPDSGLFIDSVQATDEPVGVGAEYRDRSRIGTLPGRVVEFDRPVRLSFHQVLRRRHKTVFDSNPGYVLEPAGDGARTVVHHMARGELHGLFKLLTPVVALVARRERRRVVDALQRSLEATAA